MLTYEQMTTLAAEIEAILNSRPLTQMSSDPGDLTPLTAGHFLIGAPMTAIPDKVTDSYESGQKYWSAVKALKGEFWRFWSQEYLRELQLRGKWEVPTANIVPGMLVLLKDKNIPSLEWRMGRIVKAIKGEDGYCRVVDVKTSTGITRRSIATLSPLPHGDEMVIERENVNNLPKDVKQVSSASKKRKCRPIDETYSQNLSGKPIRQRKGVLVYLPICSSSY